MEGQTASRTVYGCSVCVLCGPTPAALGSRRMAVDITPAPSLPPSLPVCDECVSLVCVHTNTHVYVCLRVAVGYAGTRTSFSLTLIQFHRRRASSQMQL